MIQIYAPNNNKFDMNGDVVLAPESCEFEAELGGSWVLDMRHPLDEDGRWKNIVKEAVISAPTFMGKSQLFRIDECEKQDKEIIVKAYPIFFDSADDVFIMDKRPTGKTGQQALDILTEGTKYNGVSDIADVGTAYFVRRNLMDCINGDSPSLVGTWGGEPLYDNYNIILNKRAGGSYGAEVRYGKNMSGISFKENMSATVTRIVPVAFNGRTLSANYVESPLIDNYAKIYTREIVFDDVKLSSDLMEGEETDGLVVCKDQSELDAALTAKCKEQFDAGIDLYSVTIEVDVVAIEDTEEYKDFKDLVQIGLGDTVTCHNSRLGISTEARAIKIKWNCITDTIMEATLGDYAMDFFSEMGSSVNKIEGAMNSDGSINASHVAGMDAEIISTIQHVVTQAYVNALHVTAGGVAADNVTGDSFKNKKLTASGTKIFKTENYTTEDIVTCQNIVNRVIDFTPAHLEKYDFTGKGYIDSSDVVRVSNLVHRLISQYVLDVSVDINGIDANRIIHTDGVVIGKNGAYMQNVTTDRLFTKTLFTVDADGIERTGLNGIYVIGDKNVHICNGLIYAIEDYVAEEGGEGSEGEAEV